MDRVTEVFEEQIASNESGLPHFDAFRGHRQHVSELVLGSSGSERATGQRLCVLGAGNAFDLELERLLEQFGELHLVDLDAAALERARQRLPPAQRSRLVAHAPLELSGMFEHVERWRGMQVTPQELMAAPGAAASRIAAALPGPFDVVASTCLLTQLQLQLLELLGDRHRLFMALRELLTLAHLRTLAALTRPGGRALLVTDLCEAAVFPVGRPHGDADLPALMRELVSVGHVIHSSHPELLTLTLQDDPLLKRAFDAAERSEPWLWQNGPDRRFLVYALVLPRIG